MAVRRQSLRIFSDWHRKPCGLRTATPEVCPVFLQGESCTRAGIIFCTGPGGLWSLLTIPCRESCGGMGSIAIWSAITAIIGNAEAQRITLNIRHGKIYGDRREIPGLLWLDCLLYTSPEINRLISKRNRLTGYEYISAQDSIQSKMLELTELFPDRQYQMMLLCKNDMNFYQMCIRDRYVDPAARRIPDPWEAC